MKEYEVLASSRFLLATMNRNGVSADDIMYLDMFYEYRDMLAEGRKEAEIRDFLSNKYKLSASTIKKAIKRLNEEYIILYDIKDFFTVITRVRRSRRISLSGFHF